MRSDADDTATGALTIGNAIYGSYTSSDSDITGLVSGSGFGSLIQPNASAHLVVGIRDNDSADSFAVISGSGNYSTDTTYDKLVFQAKADGTLTANGGNTIWHAGNDGSGSGLDADTLDGVQGSSYLRSDATDITTGYFSVDNHFRVINSGVSGQGDNNTHFNYNDTGQNYIRGTNTYFNSPIDIAGNNIVIDSNKGFNNSGSWTRNTTPYGYIEFGPANTSYAHIYTDRANFYFNKGIFSTGNITAYASDERLKENIKTIEGGLDKVCQLRGVTFDWRDDCEEKGFTPDMKTETGFIAQEVRNVLPEGVIAAPFDVDGSEGEGVSVSGEDYLTVNSQKIIPLLVEAIKELKAEIEELKKG